MEATPFGLPLFKDSGKKGKEQTPPGYIHIPGVGDVKVTRVMMKSYYYGVAIPQDIDADATAGLFDGHIGDREWTNFTRPRALPIGHEALIYKVSLAVKPTAQTKIFDVFSALQFGDLKIIIGADEFVREPLSFFPVTLYGEIAAREDDILQRLAVSREIAGKADDKERSRLMKLLSGIGIPANVMESQIVDGAIDLRKALYGTPAFVLYVVLHTITTVPIS